MKKTEFLLLSLFVALVLSSCTFHHHHYKTKRMPPGHAKKMNGSKSAKHYTPGHKNKQKHH
ncbi:MAG: hypothetical protein ACSLE0_16155 [Chitinophagaceae bacterium]